MSNKSHKPKDPKKVAAGKARAAKSLRNDKGQLLSNSFKDEVANIAEKAGFVPSSTSQLQRYYEQNEEIIDRYLAIETRSQNRYSIKTVKRTVEKTSKDVLIEIGDNEPEVSTPEEISYRMAQFEQYCYTNRNCTGVAWKKSRKGTGEPIVRMPDIQEDFLEEMDDIEFIEYCAEFGIIVWISDLSKVKDKKKKLQRQTSKDNKLKYAKRVVRDTRKTARKRKR
jgi:hypothetical protein